MLQRLRTLRYEPQTEKSQNVFARPFAGIGKDLRKSTDTETEIKDHGDKHKLENGEKSPPTKRLKTDSNNSDKENKALSSPPAKMILSPSKFGPSIPQKEISGNVLILICVFCFSGLKPKWCIV